MERIYVVSTIASLLVLAAVVAAIRRGRLRVEYALLWLGIALAMLGLSLAGGSVIPLAQAIGIVYAPSALFLFALLGAAALLFHFSIVLSDARRTQKELVQRLAAVEHLLHETVDRRSRGSARLPAGTIASGPAAAEPAAASGLSAADFRT